MPTDAMNMRVLLKNKWWPTTVAQAMQVAYVRPQQAQQAAGEPDSSAAPMQVESQGHEGATAASTGSTNTPSQPKQPANS